MIELFFSALALGFLFNAAPGAIFAQSLRRGIQGGFWPAFHVQIGSLVGDLTWAVLGLGGVAVLFQLPMVKLPLAIFGGLLLGWLAYGSFKDAAAPMPDPTRDDEPASSSSQAGSSQAASSDLSVGAALSLSNPMNITYWAGLGGTITTLGVSDPTGMAFTVFLFGFMTSSVVWCFICAGFIAAVRHMISPMAWMMINGICGAGLAYFAIHVMASVLMGVG